MNEDHDIINELAKSDDRICISLFRLWIRRNWPPQTSLIGAVAYRMCQMAQSRSWYQDRCNALNAWARTLPEPYKTEAFDILANGQIAPWNERKTITNPLDTAIIRLRERLTFIKEQIDRLDLSREPSIKSYYEKYGQVNALKSEQSFLTELLRDLDDQNLY